MLVVSVPSVCFPVFEFTIHDSRLVKRVEGPGTSVPSPNLVNFAATVDGSALCRSKLFESWLPLASFMIWSFGAAFLL